MPTTSSVNHRPCATEKQVIARQMRSINTVIDCNEKQVLVNFVILDKCVYVWISLAGSEPNLGDLVTAMETNFGVLSSSLLSIGSDKGCGLAQRLAKRFKSQIFLADTLPDLDEEDIRLVERSIVTELLSALES